MKPLSATAFRLNTFLLICMLGASVILLISCEKNDPPTNTELLSHKWHIEQALFGTDNNLNGEYYPTDDSYITFESNHHAYYTDSANASFETCFPFVWEWGSDEKELNIIFFYETRLWTIEKLTEDELWYSYIVSCGNVKHLHKCRRVEE
jgi:hypothetical protein